MTATESVKKTIWLQGLLYDLGVGKDVVDVFCVNTSAIYLKKDHVHHACTKHIDMRYHLLGRSLKITIYTLVEDKIRRTI